MYDNNLKILMKIVFFMMFALNSNPLFAQDVHWTDDILPYILFDIAFAIALWFIIILVKITTKLLTIKPH